MEWCLWDFDWWFSKDEWFWASSSSSSRTLAGCWISCIHLSFLSRFCTHFSAHYFLLYPRRIPWPHILIYYFNPMLCKFRSLRHLLFNFSEIFFFRFARILVDCPPSHLFFLWCKSSWLLAINSISSRISSSALWDYFLRFLKVIGGCWLYIHTPQRSVLNWMGCWMGWLQ